MTRWDKLIEKVAGLSNDLRFEEIDKLLQSYGYALNKPASGSHCVFRKRSAPSICIPRKSPVKRVYVELIKQVWWKKETKMKTVDEYLALPYRMEIEEDPYEGGYVISFPELPGCVTCVETWDDALEMAQDAKRAWLVAALEDGYEIPAPRGLDDYSGQFKLRIPKSLHKSLAEGAIREGISMNQYCLYLLSRNDVLVSRA